MERRSPVSARARCVATASVLAAWLLLAGPASAGGAPADAVAKAALDHAKASGTSKTPADRARSAEGLGACDHPAVARELLARLRKEGDPSVQAAVLRALGGQSTSREEVAQRVSGWLAEQAKAVRSREAKGDPGFPIDPRTGEPALATPAGEVALARKTAVAGACLAAIEALTRLRADVASEVARWTAFLQDPSDDLVVATLGALGRARCSEALPDLLALFAMYPTAATWETGGVLDLAGDDASAKRTWMVRFGHPAKQQARPRVFAALSEALVAITGRSFDDPATLSAWMSRAGRAEARKGRDR